MSEAADFSSVRDEITFFMERAWQASLGYFALVAAALAVVSSDSIDKVADDLQISRAEIFAMLAMVVNPVYLAVVIACLFALLKRGIFILRHDEANVSVQAQWERFVRGRSHLPGLPRVAWNVDNYYMVPTLFVIGCASTWGSVVCFQSDISMVKWVGIAGLLFHVVPVLMSVSLYKLNLECEKLAGSA